MKKLFSICFITCVVGGVFLFSSYISEKKLYPAYAPLYDYRRLSPDLFPSSDFLRIIALGHNATYADFLWMSLIQFVGDNAGNGKYLDFSHAILTNITDLNPYFTKAYELDLLFTPLIFADSADNLTDDEVIKINRSIDHGKKGMSILCDNEKIKKISALPYGNELWGNPDLREPCVTGMIPYYIGFHYGNDYQRGDQASYYYKIASMNRDAPDATQFLGPIALANNSDSLETSISFFLIARDGYDPSPYQCRKYADELISQISQKRALEQKWIDEIEMNEKLLKDSKDPTFPESYSANNCYDSLRRGIKQIYRVYITQISQPYPEIQNAKDLIEKGIIQRIPTISGQENFTLRKIDGKWLFRNY